MSAPMKGKGFLQLVQVIQKNSFLRYGLPMLVLIVGGAYGLKEFRTLRYEIIDKRKTVDPETEARMKQLQKEKKNSVTEEFEKMRRSDLDAWHNIRGPRPWEDSKEFQMMARENIEKTKQISIKR
ncbi:cytochrome c oxidase assembly protein COX16 homolog, mitochondrial [Strongylocentrotus purpuratus]|uniref:Cytochrome c oxidase assembly protein COX16 homolog, mitochondrial n=1 Tax=Strongylocentrotus purpuratus TaxID=7668 RepID=A0A7M7RDD8_STRPU|nr:cytochrome c oxidase assembly protein COX16 homolog, mitochondrial [Strongylocentrotus purpuratus]